MPDHSWRFLSHSITNSFNLGKSGQCDHPNPVEADHPNPEQTDQANPEQIDHPLSYQ